MQQPTFLMTCRILRCRILSRSERAFSHNLQQVASSIVDSFPTPVSLVLNLAGDERTLGSCGCGARGSVSVVDFGFLQTQIITKATDHLMSAREMGIKARLGLLALARELDNLRLACKRAGLSRSHFSRIEEAWEIYGAEGPAPQPRRRLRNSNSSSSR